MLAIGTALTRDTKVLMIDEMSLGLAPVIAKSIVPILRDAAANLGTGLLIVEQHVDLALSMADRVYVLNHGEVEMSTAASTLLHRRDLLQQAYIGGAAKAGELVPARDVLTVHAPVASSAAPDPPPAAF